MKKRHQRYHPSRSSRLYSKSTRVFLYTEIHQGNLPHKHSEKQNHIIIALDSEKAFDKTQHPIMLSLKKKSGIQGVYLTTIKLIYNKQRANIQING